MDDVLDMDDVVDMVGLVDVVVTVDMVDRNGAYFPLSAVLRGFCRIYGAYFPLLTH